MRERRHPKFYWADPGLPRAMKRQFGAPSAEERGHLFEGWIAGVLRAYRDYRGAFEGWFYWAAGQGSNVEVDFLCRRGRELVALEAKASARLAEADLRGLRAIAALPDVRRRLVVYGGTRAQRTADGIDVLPVPELLRQLQAGRLFP